MRSYSIQFLCRCNNYTTEKTVNVPLKTYHNYLELKSTIKSFVNIGRSSCYSTDPCGIPMLIIVKKIYCGHRL